MWTRTAFYASVEMQRHPELRDKPLAVCGSQEDRHGIVLTANYIAKPRGVKTGMAIWQARQCCPDLVVLPPDMAEYIRISKNGKGNLRGLHGSSGTLWPRRKLAGCDRQRGPVRYSYDHRQRN